jgi:hypothetical protein
LVRAPNLHHDMAGFAIDYDPWQSRRRVFCLRKRKPSKHRAGTPRTVTVKCPTPVSQPRRNPLEPACGTSLVISNAGPRFSSPASSRPTTRMEGGREQGHLSLRCSWAEHSLLEPTRSLLTLEKIPVDGNRPPGGARDQTETGGPEGPPVTIATASADARRLSQQQPEQMCLRAVGFSDRIAQGDFHF